MFSEKRIKISILTSLHMPFLVSNMTLLILLFGMKYIAASDYIDKV